MAISGEPTSLITTSSGSMKITNLQTPQCIALIQMGPQLLQEAHHSRQRVCFYCIKSVNTGIVSFLSINNLSEPNCFCPSIQKVWVSRIELWRRLQCTSQSKVHYAPGDCSASNGVDLWGVSMYQSPMMQCSNILILRKLKNMIKHILKINFSYTDSVKLYWLYKIILQCQCKIILTE